MTPPGYTLARRLPSAAHRAARLEAAANRALHAPGYPELWNLHLEIDRGRLVLHGTVSTYYLKQVAQAAVMSLNEVADVANLIEVQPVYNRS